MSAAGWTAEEVRLAMAWNGGVSLAVWMGGAAVELDVARRAHLGPQSETGNERSLYHELTVAFRRELVIDILAGASAGGINGALLSAAIISKRELRPSFLRQRWLDLGDLSSLLRPVNEEEPVSLMRGDHFQVQLRKAFRALTGEKDADKDWLRATKPSQPGLAAGDVVLDVQATSVLGAQRAFSDQWRQTLYAREYRAPIRFRIPEDFTSDALTAAARASASFPAAFEPVALINKSARLGGFPGVKRWAIDGGLLENAPIRPAIELIATRAAERPVSRFVCYVNAAPSAFREDEDDPIQPVLGKVLADVINLPREGRFIEQLIAVEDATQRSLAARHVTKALLAMPEQPLLATANALFAGYCRSRTRSSLRELFTAAAPDGGSVGAMITATEDALEGRPLPWIPASLDPPGQASEWRWGLRAAQRVLLLQLDLLNEAAEHDNPVEEARRAEALLAHRQPINAALARLEDARLRFAGSPAIRKAARELATAADEANEPEFERRLGELDTLMVGFRCEAYDAVFRGMEALFAGLAAEQSAFEHLAGVLVPDEEGSAPPGLVFLERALCIEVIRRAAGPDRDLEPTQELRFVQLTPLAPTRIFTSTPLRDEGPNSGRQKLTGLDLLHFSAFYRGSWRANDFMWGRLDAATRIVDLLVNATRMCRIVAEESFTEGANPLLTRLAAELVPLGTTQPAADRQLLVREALLDARLEWQARNEPSALTDEERKLVEEQPAPQLLDSVAAAAAAAGSGRLEPPDLRELLRSALEADLADARQGGFFTRVVCARAGHYEILLQELEPLARATADDERLGCFTKPLPYDSTSAPLAQARTMVSGDALPKKLGSGVPEEATSTLAVRTLSHAAIVLLSALKTANVPMGGLFGFLKAPFLSLSGLTAAKLRYRATALLVFVAASFYLTARAISAEKAEAKLGLIWSSSTLAELMAVLGVLGLVLLPFWRAVRTRGWRRVIEGSWGTAMFLASGLAAMVAAVFAVGFGNAITSTDGFSLPRWLALAVILVPLGASAVIRHFRVPLLGRKRFSKFTGRVGVTALATIAVVLLLIVYSYPTLRSELTVGELWTGLRDWDNWRARWDVLRSPSQVWESITAHWRDAAVIAAYASVPLAVIYGLHGFVRQWIAAASVRLKPLGRPFRWLRDLAYPASTG